MLVVAIFLLGWMLTIVQALQFYRPAFVSRKECSRKPSISIGVSVTSSSVVEDGKFAETFVAQKNYILLDKLMHPAHGNLTEVAMQYVNFCDESFNVFLSDRIALEATEEAKKVLGRIRYEVNSARQRKLIEADTMLRSILAAGGLKQMEAKLAYHLRRSDIDMAFMVILHLNIEDAVHAKAEQAVQVMTHLRTLIQEHQDSVVSPPVRLLRMLVRTDEPMVRKQMLRQKLVRTAEQAAELARINNSRGNNDRNTPDQNSKSSETIKLQAKPTTVPQCESIVVEAVKSWGGADVSVEALEETIQDVLSQVPLHKSMPKSFLYRHYVFAGIF